MYNVLDMLRCSPNIKVEITGKDLVSLVDAIVDRIKTEVVNTPDDDGFYSVDEIMTIYNIKARSTLYKWDKKGYLPCEKIGASVMYRKKIVHKILGNPKC